MEARKVKYFKEYFREFFLSQTKGVQEKILYVIRYVQQTERWNQRFVKYLQDGLFEIRVEWQSNIYRVFFILDEGNIVVLFNGFQKRTQQTPVNELERAKRIKKEYYESKERPQ